MIPPDQFAALETSIYEAAVVPELWPKALAAVSASADAAGTALVCINERGVHMTTDAAMERAGRRFVEEGWMARNSRGQAVIDRGFVGLPRFVTQEELLTPEQIATDPMINDLFRAEGLGYAAGFIVQLPHGDIVIVNAEQYTERGPMVGESLARLDSLYPHLARAALLAGRSDFQRVKTAVETLTALGMPAAAVAPNARVVMANDDFAGAVTIWTTRGGDKVALTDAVADQLLTDALEQLKSTDGPRSIPVRAVAGGAVTAVLQVIPIRRSGYDIFGGTSAILVLSQPRAAGQEQATLIQSLFDLTPAELAVARAIAGGQTVGQIALGSGRSVNTVRNQLKSIMGKTGSTRQAELIVLMNQLAGRAN